jgi:O-antigen/teichoic acid export membrane protein
MRRLHGFSFIVAATAVAGAAGYVITWLVAREIGLVDYPVFAVFWAFMYVLIGSLSGIQQEITRATQPEPAPRAGGHNHHARNFALIAALVVAAAIVGSAFLWVGSVFPHSGWTLVWPLAVGAASWVFVATILGSLYGTSQWLPIATIVVLDPMIRLAALVVGLNFTHDLAVLGWLVALPVPATIVLLSPMLKRRLARVPETDVGIGRLTWNVTRTVLAAAALSLMVSGLPLLLRISTQGQSVELGLLILTITLTRAPLIVTVMSLQSFLIVRFRDHASSMWRTLFVVLGLLLAVAVVFAALGWAFGPPIFGWLFPKDPLPAGWLIATLVGSSAMVAAMCITAAAALASSEHFVYSLGWVVAAVVTVASLFVPLPLTPRAVLALFAGPASGLVIHGIGMALVRSRTREFSPRTRDQAAGDG